MLSKVLRMLFIKILNKLKIPWDTIDIYKIWHNEHSYILFTLIDQKSDKDDDIEFYNNLKVHNWDKKLIQIEMIFIVLSNMLYETIQFDIQFP